MLDKVSDGAAVQERFVRFHLTDTVRRAPSRDLASDAPSRPSPTRPTLPWSRMHFLPLRSEHQTHAPTLGQSEHRSCTDRRRSGGWVLERHSALGASQATPGMYDALGVFDFFQLSQ
jgi:hypothetical protein